jgi:GNAT superfamily N-acetyltransferase
MKYVTSTSKERFANLLIEWTMEDKDWLDEEFGRLPIAEDMLSYIQTYEGMGCEFRLWFIDEEPVAITAVLDQAPSNQKSWLGTIVVDPAQRKKGVGQDVIHSIVSEKEEVVFAGIPLERNQWSLFLGKCGFEQYAIEGEEKKYLIFVHPNEG